MRVTRKRLLLRCMALAAGGALLLGAAACGKKQGDGGGKGGIPFAEVWSLPATQKVMKQGGEYYSKGPASLSFDAARNETESAQLVLTASGDIAEFSLEAAGLKGSGGELPADAFEVCLEKFVTYADVNGSGEVADPLLPMKTASEYGENTAKKGENAAFWVTVRVPADAAPGTYTGEFTLTARKKGAKSAVSAKIPVSVRVRDIALPDTLSAKTLFSWRYDRVSPGELDGSLQMMTTYYDFFRSYGISLQSLPLGTLSGEEFVAAADKYYDSVTSYCLLKVAGDISGEVIQANPKSVREQILALAEKSTPERNLLGKLMIYSVDEPNFQLKERRDYVKRIRTGEKTFLTGVADEVAADTSGKYSAFKSIPGWREYIEDIPSIIPMGSNSVAYLLDNENTAEGRELIDALNCICPGFAAFEEQNIDKIKAFCERNGIKLWWYGCVGPKPPGPTYHISDENLLSSRSVSWLQEKYGIEGNLYWDAAAYTDEQGEWTNEFVNVYETPYHISHVDGASPAGDGNLAYPGAPYGLKEPLPSTRLMSIRDGMEDYELLKALRAKLQAGAAGFGDGFSPDDAMEVYYRSLAYNGYMMNRDGENGLDFTALRGDLLATLEGYDSGLALLQGKVAVEGDTARVEFYTSEGSSLAVGGKKLTPAAPGRYEYTANIAKSRTLTVTVTAKDGKKATYERFIASPTHVLAEFDGGAERLTFSEGGSAELLADDTHAADSHSVKLTVRSRLTGDALSDGTFTPFASVGTSLFGDKKVGDFARLFIDVYNPGDKPFTVKVRFYAGGSFTEFGQYQISPGAGRITLNVANQSFTQMASVDRIAFEFENSGTVASPDVRVFHIDRIIGEK